MTKRYGSCSIWKMVKKKSPDFLIWISLRLLLLFLAMEGVFAEHDGELAEVYFSRAAELYTQNENKKAYELINIALEFHPEYADALFLKAMLTKSGRKHTYEVLDLFLSALKSDNWKKYSKSVCIVKIAEIYHRIKKYETALHYLDKIKKKSRNDPDFLFILSRCYINSGKVDKGEYIREKGKDAFPDDKRFFPGQEKDKSEKNVSDIANHTGKLVLDINNDGYYEKYAVYENGIIQELLVDSNQDGINEYFITFSKGIPVKAEVLVGRNLNSYIFKEYPHVSIILIKPAFPVDNRWKRKYFLIKGKLKLDLFDEEEIKKSFPLEIKNDIKYITEDTIGNLSLKMFEYEYKNGESILKIKKYFMEGFQKIERMDPDEEGTGYILEVFNNLIKTGRKDFNNDGVYEIQEKFGNENDLKTVLIDENNNDIFEYKIFPGNPVVSLWDFNEDGNYDCRETVYRNSRIIREFSSKFNNVFDIKMILVNSRIKRIIRGGVAKTVSRDKKTGFFWIGKIRSIHLDFPSGFYGILNKGSKRYYVFNMNDDIYIEELE